MSLHNISNRRVYFRLPGEKNREEHSMKDVVTTLGEGAFSVIQYTRANGEVRTAYVADISMKIKNLPGKRRVLVVKPNPQGKDMKNIDVLMSNDTLSDVASILRGWSFRAKIDKFYLHGKDDLLHGKDDLLHGKDDLGFDQYQVRDHKPIRRHWYMVFLMYSFIIWHRQCGSFRKWCTHTCETFGQLLDVIRTKLMLHFQKWSVSNQKHWHDFPRMRKVSQWQP